MTSVPQNFNDGGSFYQSLLNRITRDIFKDPNANVTQLSSVAIWPSRLSLLERDHDISAIIAQIEIERATERALQRKNKRRRELATVDTPYISHTGVDHDEAGANTSTDTNTARKSSKAKGRKHAANFRVEVESPPRRRPKFGLEGNATASASADAPTVRNLRRTATKRCR